MFVLVLTLICALLVAIFAVQNATAVVIQFFWIQSEVPLVLVILGSVLAGAVITFLLALWREFRLRRKRKAAAIQEAILKESPLKEGPLKEGPLKEASSKENDCQGEQKAASVIQNQTPSATPPKDLTSCR